MTETHAGLSLFRDQLRDAIARDLARSRARKPRMRVVAGPLGGVPAALATAAGVAAVAAVAGVAVALSGGPSVSSADAAIIRHVRAALSEPAGAILHERAIVTAGSATTNYELWIQTDAPYRYRVVKWGHQGTGTSGASYDLAATFRSLVDSGQATVDSTTAIDGTPAYKLTVTGASDKFANGTVYVSTADYHPLLIDTTANGGERISFQTYEYLPSSPATLQLLSASAG
jgi:hypothetical protein